LVLEREREREREREARDLSCLARREIEKNKWWVPYIFVFSSKMRRKREEDKKILICYEAQIHGLIQIQYNTDTRKF